MEELNLHVRKNRLEYMIDDARMELEMSIMALKDMLEAGDKVYLYLFIEKYAAEYVQHYNELKRLEEEMKELDRAIERSEE